MKYPRAEDYQDALQNPTHHFFDDELKRCSFEKQFLGLPRGYSGRTTITFHLINGNNQWAVRCFHRYIPDLRERYLAISALLKERKLNFIVPTECLEDGISLNGKIYPIIKMQWVHGTTLHKFLSDNYGNPEKLLDIAQQFREIVKILETEKIAHGDLQHGNIIIEKGKIILIDYDGVFLPEIAHLHSTDLGHSNYQHHKRDETHYHELLDRFSAIVIYFGLIAIADNPALFIKYHNQDNIIFRKEDFTEPEKSSLVADLLHQESMRFYCENFLDICKGEIEEIPSLEEFLSKINLFEPEPTGQSEPAIPDSNISDSTSTSIDQGSLIRKKRAEFSKLSKTLNQSSEAEKYRSNIEYCLEILDDDPTNSACLLKLAESYYNIGDYSNARDIFEKVKLHDITASRNIDSSIGDSFKGLARENQKTKEKIQYYLDMLKDHPNSIKYLDPLGELYFKIGEFQKAIDIFEKLNRNDPRIEIIRNLKNSERDRLQEKITQYHTLLEDYPDDFWHLIGLGESYYHLGNYVDALKNFEKVAEIDSDTYSPLKELISLSKTRISHR